MDVKAVKDAPAAPVRFVHAEVGMVMTDPHQDDNPIVYVNEAFVRKTGYARSAAIGRNCRFLQGEETDPKTVAELREAVARHEDAAVDIVNYHADGSKFVNRLIISPLKHEDDACAYWVGVVSERGEDADVESLDSHLREIQHRVKNHLSMIISMIRMQARGASDSDSFAALARRIETLQLLYEEMSLADGTRTDDLVPLGSFLSRIANAIAHIDGRAGVRVNVSVDSIDAPVHSATQLGLILSEVLTNAFQHAFEGRDSGLVEVEVTQLSKGGLRLRVSDDGVGLPADIKWPKPSSLGGRIMSSIIKTLDGEMDISRGGAGTTVTIDVPSLDAAKS